MRKIIIFIILLATLIIPLVIYNGAVGDFAPTHMAIIYETVQLGHNSDVASEDVPGFYIFGAITSILTGISAKELLFLPVQLLPFVSIFFCLIYKISKNYLLSGIVTFIEIITDVTGSARIYFWPHGFGYILFYIILFSLLGINNDKNRLKNFRLPIIIIGISLTFMSYNSHILSLIYLSMTSFMFVILSIYEKEKKKDYLFFSKNLFYIFIIIVITQFGLSNFFYVTITTTIKTLNVELSGIDKFFMSYSSYDIQTPLRDLYMVYPKIISILSAAKYLVLFISIVIFILIMVNKLMKHKETSLIDLFILFLLLAFLSYSMLRIYIGDIVFSLFYLPGIICTIRLYDLSKLFKKWTIFVVSIILIITPIYYGLNDRYNLINKDENKYENVRFPANWYFDHKINSVFSIAISDELTSGLSRLYILEKLKNENIDISYKDIREKMARFSTQNAMFLTQKTNEPDVGKYFIVNYNVNSITLDNWIFLKSWKFSKNKIENNINVYKVYDIDNIAIYEKR